MSKERKSEKGPLQHLSGRNINIQNLKFRADPLTSISLSLDKNVHTPGFAMTVGYGKFGRPSKQNN